ncbi:hypothetical protein BSE24067_00738 [Burkholderia seminalis]|nr:hypothetical protein BSE24067_00738 [Burkholderia seminalis]
MRRRCWRRRWTWCRSRPSRFLSPPPPGRCRWRCRWQRYSSRLPSNCRRVPCWQCRSRWPTCRTQSNNCWRRTHWIRWRPSSNSPRVRSSRARRHCLRRWRWLLTGRWPSSPCRPTLQWRRSPPRRCSLPKTRVRMPEHLRPLPMPGSPSRSCTFRWFALGRRLRFAGRWRLRSLPLHQAQPSAGRWPSCWSRWQLNSNPRKSRFDRWRSHWRRLRLQDLQ